MKLSFKWLATSLVALMGMFTLSLQAGGGTGYEKDQGQQNEQKTEQGTIVDVAVSAPQFSTLVKALQAADLTGALAQAGPFTVFAPTNEAFAKLPPDTLKNLMKPENIDQLKAILTYHVVPGKVLSKDLQSMKVKTLNGEDLTIEVKDGEVTVNGVKVIKPDIEASNGVIHGIDGVLIPQSMQKGG